jgi:hypothetical protein
MVVIACGVGWNLRRRSPVIYPTMPRVLIVCPSTNKPVPTGLSIDVEAFSMEPFHGRVVHCPHCQLTHEWATDDAYLDADDPYPKTAERRCPFCFSPDVALTGGAIQATDGGPVKLGYSCRTARCRARFFLV